MKKINNIWGRLILGLVLLIIGGTFTWASIGTFNDYKGYTYEFIGKNETWTLQEYQVVQEYLVSINSTFSVDVGAIQENTVIVDYLLRLPVENIGHLSGTKWNDGALLEPLAYLLIVMSIALVIWGLGILVTGYSIVAGSSKEETEVKKVEG